MNLTSDVTVTAPAVKQQSPEAIHALEQIVLQGRFVTEDILHMLEKIYRSEADRLDGLFTEMDMEAKVAFQYQRSLRFFRGLARQAKAARELIEDLPGLKPKDCFDIIEMPPMSLDLTDSQ